MLKEIDYNTYSAEKREAVMVAVYAELGVSAKTGWVRFQSRGGRLGLHYADELGFWLAHDRQLTPVEAGAEDTGGGFHAWATLVDKSGVSASAEASVVKTNKRVSALREELQGASLAAIEKLALEGDWVSPELQRGLAVALAPASEGEAVALTACLARILAGAQKKGEARVLALELLPVGEALSERLEAAKSREEFRALASEYVGRLAQALKGAEREKTLRAFVLAVAKTVEDLGARALALDRAKARAAVQLCQGRIVKGIKRIVETPSKGTATEVAKAKPVEVKPKAAEADKPVKAVEAGRQPAKAAEVKPKAVAAKATSKPAEARPKVVAKEEVSDKAKRASAKQQAYVRALMRKAGVKEANISLRMGKLVGTAKAIEELSGAEAAVAIDKLKAVLGKKKP
jgi:hypothetical protein